MSYISPRIIVSTLIRAYKVRSKRILTEVSEQSLVATTTRSIPLTAFNFSPQQIALTLFHLSQINHKSTSTSCFYPLIQRFLTLPCTLTDPYLTLPILHSIQQSRIALKPSGIIQDFISSVLKREIITQYLNSITNTASLIYLVDSIGRSSGHAGELPFYQPKVIISQVLDYYSGTNSFQILSEQNFSETESLASLVTLLTLGSHHGLDISKYSNFLPLMLRIDTKKFPKHTLIDALEITANVSTFNEFCTHTLTELSGFDDFSDYPRHLLQRVLLVAASKTWKNLKLLDNISRVLCETSHTNIGISSIVAWLEAFKQLNYQNKSALELLLRQALSVKGGSDKYPIIYQLFRDLQFEHFLLSRLQILAIHPRNHNPSDSGIGDSQVAIKDIGSPINNKGIEITDKKNAAIEKLLLTTSKDTSPKTYSKVKVGHNTKKFPTVANDIKTGKNVKLLRKTERNRENIAKFWKLSHKQFTRKGIRDHNWRLSISGNTSRP
ncbi:hypothetical protein BmR1_04g07222 [Babesia microti strain RI]|uniref:Uncharacterized protein n=1 Tax=Babesia microti (strain RI) TaxID=1133968 RepID=A0A1N6LXZ0_BABMR|nr:hypothetical protein BmR1_04g07222 [Babesia microti strain RI]SIO73731.1 hypothetical protein BmR1_04g07222 [Babesia microti strain RI]|eukprot:XP_021337797.1 hypothetical protein BmR1_04g07222 [Babesia microti strain RI]